MLKKMITYTDFDDVSRTEAFYFNLTKAEIQEMELRVEGGYKKMLETMIAKENISGVIMALKEIMLAAYGEKSPDGRRFIKSPELRASFEQTGAYSELFMELIQDADAAAVFMNGVIPQVAHDAKAGA